MRREQGARRSFDINQLSKKNVSGLKGKQAEKGSRLP
jgi:hypothetical protein